MFYKYLYKIYEFNHKWMTNRIFLGILIVLILGINTIHGVYKLLNS